MDPEVRAEQEMAAEENLNSIVPTANGNNDALFRANVAAKARQTQQRRSVSVQESIPSNGVVNVPKSQKNARRSRAKAGRGDAKKEGAGGKFTWGRRNELYEDKEFMDADDPNYDSDAQLADVTFEELDPEVQLEQLDRFVKPILDDFYSSRDMRAAIAQLSELGLTADCWGAFVRLLLSETIDHKASAREQSSELLGELVKRKVLSSLNVSTGLRDVLKRDMSDLNVDCPLITEFVGNFIARAKADLALHQTHLDMIVADKHSFGTDLACEAVERAVFLLSAGQSHRLHDIWGVGGAQRPVRQLQHQMKLILEEYLLSNEKAEAARCLRELEVPHFNHEFVYQIGLLCMESMNARACVCLAELLAHVHAEGELTDDMVTQGFIRLYNDMNDIQLDVPGAYAMCERLLQSCALHKQLMALDLARRMPKRGRGRVLSEGSGGRLSVCDSDTINKHV